MWFTTSQVKPTSQDSATQGEGEKKYSTLSEEGKGNVEKILFLLEKFVWEMHAIMKFLWSLMVYRGPYLVKQCREELNKMCQIEPLNTKFEGAKVNSVETVFKVHISDFLKENSDFDLITLTKSKSKSMVTVQE